MMSLDSIRSLNKKVKNGLVAALFLGVQVGFATAPFLPAQTAEAAAVCVNDQQGANDEPGQKDLTRFCEDSDAGTISWNWDELSVSGNGQSLDACALFDTDGDGLANRSLCITTQDGDPFSKIIYTCNDTRPDRCAGADTGNPATSSCNVAVTATQPFAAGSSTPNDLTASCSPTVADTASGDLIDVCSYPSGQPNSDPSDCIVFKAKTGKLEVRKDLVPDNVNKHFNLQVDAVTKVTTNGDGTTGEVVVTEGNHTVGETAGANTSLADYTSTISCKDLNGQGNVVASGNGTSLANIPVPEASDIVCIITNTASGSLTIVKDAQPNDAQDFAFTTTGAGLSGFTLDDDADPTLSNTRTFSGLSAGTYSVAETAVSGWDLTTATCNDGSTVSNIQLSAGENVICTFTNVKRGQLIVQKTTDPSGDPTVFNISASGSGTIAGGGAGTVTDATDQSYEVTPGTYSVAETVPSGWSKTGDTCQNVVVAAGATVTCLITNTKLGSFTIIKNALPDDPQDFTFSVNNLVGGNFFLDDDADPALSNTKVFSDLLPGTYSVTEQSLSGWALTGLTCDGNPVVGSTGSVILTAGQNKTCTYTNTKLGSISGIKYTSNANSSLGPVLGGWTIFIDSNGNGILDGGEQSDVTDTDGTYSFADLLPDTYTLWEVLQAGWTQIFGPSPVNLTAGQTSTGNNFGNFQNASIGGFKWNDKNANDVVDQGEEKLNGWTITLYNDGLDVDTDLDDVVATTVTAGEGAYNFTNLAPGTYAICETQQTNWIQTFPNANGCHTIVINVSGETNEANFGNQGRGNIIVIKNVDTDGDGTVDEQDVTDWTWDIDDSGNFATGSGNAQNVAAGNYVVSEDQKPNYTATAQGCNGGQTTPEVLSPTSVGVSVAPGETITCTFTNTRDTATITIIKDAIPFEGDTSDQEFGFNFDSEPFTLADSGHVGDNTKTFEFVKTGESYDVTEQTPEGWTLDGVECSNEEEVPEISRLLVNLIDHNVADIANGVAITPEANKHITCVFTNTRDVGTLTLVKDLTPTADQGKFNLSINGEVLANNVGDNGTTGAIALPTDTYSASETAGTNTNLNDYESSYVCRNGDTVLLEGNGTMISQIEIAKDQDVVCTFYNNKGQILGEEVPALVNTGSNILGASFISLLFIGAVGGLAVATRRTATSRS